VTSEIQCLGGSADGRVVKVSDPPSRTIDFPVRLGDGFVADRYELMRTYDGRLFYVNEDYEGNPPPRADAK